MHLDFSAEVRTADGHMVGLLSGVVVNPSAWAVTHVVVRYGLIVAVDRAVPRAGIRAVEDHHVQLALTAHELGEMPELEVRGYVPLAGVDIGSDARPTPSAPGLWTHTPAIVLQPLVGDHTTDEANVEEMWRSVPEGSLVLREGLVVRAHDGKAVGRLKEVAMDPASGAVTAILISRAGHVRAAPAAWIERGDEKTGIVLAVDRRTVDELPDEQ